MPDKIVSGETSFGSGSVENPGWGVDKEVVSVPVAAGGSSDRPLLDALNTTGENQESDEKMGIKSRGAFIDLYRTQLFVASMLSDFIRESSGDSFETHINYDQLIIDIRDDNGKKVAVTLENLGKYQSSIIVKNSSLDGCVDPCFFKLSKEGKLEEICLVPDRISDDTVIKDIEQVGDFYRVTVCGIDWEGYQKEDTDLCFIVDCNGNYVEKLGDQMGDETFYLTDDIVPSPTGSGCYEYIKNLDNDEKSYHIFNSKMEEVAEYGAGWMLVYCDDNVCVCFSEGSGDTKKYKVFCKNLEMKEGFVHELGKDFEGDKLLEGYFNEFNNKSNQKYSCEVSYNSENKSLSITNSNGDTIWNQEGVIGVNSNYYIIKDGIYYRIQLNNLWDESSLLAIEFVNVSDIHKRTSLVINKETGKRFDNLDLKNLQFEVHFGIVGNLLIVGGDDTLSGSVYNDKFDYLGNTAMFSRNNGNMVWVEIDKKYYVVDRKTGKILTEFVWIDSEFFDFKDGDLGYDSSSSINEDDGRPSLEYRIDDRQIYVFSNKDKKIIAHYSEGNGVNRYLPRGCGSTYVYRYLDERKGDYYFVVFAPDKGFVQVRS